MLHLRTIAAAATIGAGLGLAAPALANTVTIAEQGSDEFGTPRWNVNQTVIHPGGDPNGQTYGAGLFRLTKDGVRFDAFCIELLTNINLPGQYTHVTDLSTVFGPTVISRLDALVSHGYPLIRQQATNNLSSRFASAFQLSVWEIVTETEVVPPGTDVNLSLTSGVFQVAPGASGNELNAQNLAADWLGKIATGAWQATGARFSFLLAPGSTTPNAVNQDLIAIPIPVPAGFLLIGTAVVGLTLLRRRPQAA